MARKPVYSWDNYMNFTKVFFRPIKHMKLIRCWFPKRSANFYYFSVVKREWDIVLSLCVAITIFCIVYFEAIAPGLDDVPNNRLKYADVPGTISQKTSVKFTFLANALRNLLNSIILSC